MAQFPSPVIRRRIWRGRRRLAVAIAATIAAMRFWHGWLGWTVGLATAVGVLLFEWREWWNDSPRGGGSGDPEPSGPARYREAGTIGVRLVAAGERPQAVAHRLRLVTDLDDAAIGELLAGVPATVPVTLSLRSAERVVAGLRNVGADAQVAIGVRSSADLTKGG